MDVRQQNSEEDVTMGGPLRRRQKRFRQEACCKETKRLRTELKNGPPWMCESAVQRTAFHRIWYADTADLWTILAASLQILQCMLQSWDFQDRSMHTSPYYAFKWIYQARATDRHWKRLQLRPLTIAAQRDMIGELIDSELQSTHQKEHLRSKLLEVDIYLGELTRDKIWTGLWSIPFESDMNWKHCNQFNSLLRNKFEGAMRLSKLYSYAWNKFCDLASQKRTVTPKGSVKRFLLPNDDGETVSDDLAAASSRSENISSTGKNHDADTEGNQSRVQDTVRNYARLMSEYECFLTALKDNEFYDFFPESHSADFDRILSMIHEECLDKRRIDYNGLLMHPKCSDSILAWTTVSYQCIKTLNHRRLLPLWFKKPKDDIGSIDCENTGGYCDPGRLNLEILWFALRLWNFTDVTYQDQLCSPGLKPYDKSYGWSKGITNFRGRMIEGLLTAAKHRSISRNSK
jgi:hypothetical protein